MNTVRPREPEKLLSAWFQTARRTLDFPPIRYFKLKIPNRREKKGFSRNVNPIASKFFLFSGTYEMLLYNLQLCGTYIHTYSFDAVIYISIISLNPFCITCHSSKNTANQKYVKKPSIREPQTEIFDKLIKYTQNHRLVKNFGRGPSLYFWTSDTQYRNR